MSNSTENLVYPHYSDPPVVLPELPAEAAVTASPSSAGSSKLIENILYRYSTVIILK